MHLLLSFPICCCVSCLLFGVAKLRNPWTCYYSTNPWPAGSYQALAVLCHFPLLLPLWSLIFFYFLREREREIYQSGMRFIDWSVMVHVCFLPPQHNLAGNCSKALPSRYSLMRVHRWCGCVLAAICSNVTEIDRGKILIYRNPPLTWNQNFRSSIFTGENFPLFTVLLFISRIEIRVSDITLSLGLISIGLFSHVLK